MAGNYIENVRRGNVGRKRRAAGLAGLERLESRAYLSASVVTSFPGSGPNGWIPPDTMGAVGPNNIMEFINDQVVIRDKSGNALLTESGNTFWANSGVASVAAYDSRIVYDPVSQRWFASSDIDQGKADSRLIVGVSTSSDPMQPWKAFTFTSNTSSNWADYPTLGVDANGVYLTANLFSLSNRYAGARVYAISKSAFLNFAGGGAAPSVKSFSLSPGGTLLATYDFNAGKAANAPEIIADRNGSNIELRSVTWNNGVASLSSASLIAIPGINGGPANGVQPGSGTEYLDAGDGRLNNATITNSSGYMWTLAPTTVNGRAGAVWMQLNLSTRAIVQSGILASANADILFPSIAANDNGDVVIGYTEVSSTKYASVYVNGRLGTDAPGTLQGEVLVQAGTATYTDNGGAGAIARWGDYSQTVVDPSDNTKFWTYQEYSPSATAYRFGTYWGQVSLTPVVVSPPAAPSVLSAVAGSSSQINLKWTDNSTNESGFLIFRSTDGVTFTQLPSTAPAGATTFSDTGLTAGKQYWYYVEATNSAGPSAASNGASATTATVSLPAAPSNLVAMTAKHSAIQLTWKDNAANESGFYIEISIDGTKWTQLATVGPNVTSYTDNGLKRGTTYYYRVRAYNSFGPSAYSNVISAVATNDPKVEHPEADWPLAIPTISESLLNVGLLKL